MTPVRIPTNSLELDFDINACGKIELHERVHRLRSWIDNV
jgi:hypothetical protein